MPPLEVPFPGLQCCWACRERMPFPGCCGGPCARAGECWGLCCQGPEIWLGKSGIPGNCIAVRGLVQHKAQHLSWSRVAAPTPHILHLTPCSPPPPADPLSCWGCPATATGWGNGGGTYLSPHSRQAEAGSPVWSPAATDLFIDGVTSAAAAIRALVTSSAQLVTETGPGGAGRSPGLHKGALGWGADTGVGVPIV